MRLFVAAELPEALREALADNIADLQAAGIAGKPTDPGNLHVTLAFLGDCDESAAPAVRKALDTACDGWHAFDVELGDYGVFPQGGSTLVWQGFADAEELRGLALDVREALSRAGISFDGAHPFSAHVTLLRKAPADLDPAELDDPWVDAGRIERITLFASHLSENGPAYEALWSTDLAAPYEHPEGRLLLIDADACPVTREALAEARRAHVPVLLVGNGTQNLSKHLKRTDPTAPRPGFWAATMNVQGGADSADFQIATVVRSGDIVVTQDFGVAAMALGADAQALGVRGRAYTREAIDTLMLVRHEEKKIRRQGGRTKGPAGFTDDDRARFATALRRLLQEP